MTFEIARENDANQEYFEGDCPIEATKGECLQKLRTTALETREGMRKRLLG